MESIDIYRNSYHYIQKLKCNVCCDDKFTVLYNNLDNKTASWLRDRIKVFLSKITGLYQKRRGERDFVKDDYMEFVDRLERSNSTNSFTVDFSKLNESHATELRCLIKETLNVRSNQVWQTISGWSAGLPTH